MRFSTIALTFLALGIASVSSAPSDAPAGLAPRNSAVASRDFVRKHEIRSPKKHHHHHPHKSSRGESMVSGAMVTWYGGGQLDNPACGGSKPSSSDHVVAVKQGGQFKCGDTVHIHHNNKMVSAKVVDYCASCAETHVDMSQGAFKELASLDEGEIHGVKIRVIPGSD